MDRDRRPAGVRRHPRPPARAPQDLPAGDLVLGRRALHADQRRHVRGQRPPALAERAGHVHVGGRRGRPTRPRRRSPPRGARSARRACATRAGSSTSRTAPRPAASRRRRSPATRTPGRRRGRSGCSTAACSEATSAGRSSTGTSTTTTSSSRCSRRRGAPRSRCSTRATGSRSRSSSRPDQTPRWVGLGGHCLGLRRAWSAAPRIGRHPVARIARGSHAAWFANGVEAHPAEGRLPVDVRERGARRRQRDGVGHGHERVGLGPARPSRASAPTSRRASSSSRPARRGRRIRAHGASASSPTSP